MTTIRLTPKQTTVREGWQWTGQPREEWPAWVKNCARHNGTRSEIHMNELRLVRRSGPEIVVLNEWLVRDPASTDITPYTDDELWKEFER